MINCLTSNCTNVSLALLEDSNICDSSFGETLMQCADLIFDLQLKITLLAFCQFEVGLISTEISEYFHTFCIHEQRNDFLSFKDLAAFC